MSCQQLSVLIKQKQYYRVRYLEKGDFSLSLANVLKTIEKNLSGFQFLEETVRAAWDSNYSELSLLALTLLSNYSCNIAFSLS